MIKSQAKIIARCSLKIKVAVLNVVLAWYKKKIHKNPTAVTALKILSSQITQ